MIGREFKYLEEKYGLSSARNYFEEICLTIVDNGSGVQAYPGDDGIDIMVRKGNKTSVYQCKFFMDRLGEPQKNQIRKSFNSLMKSKHKDSVESWTLCIATTLTSEETHWKNNWFSKKEKEFNIKMNLIDKGQIINKLKLNGMYDKYFGTITIDRDLINNFNDKEYISFFSPLMNEIANNDFKYPNIDFILYVENLINKYHYDPRFKDSNFIELLDDLIKLLVFNAYDGIIRNEQILNKIFEIRKNIRTEYNKLFINK
ncbi:hypothetical protein QIW52_14765 [Clostridioides difficile]|nr:hypothetical protein [Clostridioides difficile]